MPSNLRDSLMAKLAMDLKKAQGFLSTLNKPKFSFSGTKASQNTGTKVTPTINPVGSGLQVPQVDNVTGTRRAVETGQQLGAQEMARRPIGV